MSAYHVMLVHFPIALWSTAALIIGLRFLSGGTLARAAEELGLKLENATLKVTRPQRRPERTAERT